MVSTVPACGISTDKRAVVGRVGFARSDSCVVHSQAPTMCVHMLVTSTAVGAAQYVGAKAIGALCFLWVFHHHRHSTTSFVKNEPSILRAESAPPSLTYQASAARGSIR